MQNDRAAIMRKLSDPDFQASLVNKCIGLVLVLTGVIIMFVIHDIYIWANPPTPRYFYIDGKNPPRVATPLTSPIVDDQQLLDWTVRGILAAYNVNYHDYPQQLNVASRRFTLNGWNSFATSYIQGGNYEAMKKGMLLCFAQAQRAAVISEAKVIDGALAYRIQVPILQTCQNSQQQSTQNLMMTALVLRTNAEDHVDGLVIAQLVAVAR
jgi:intracellular multiplication protein IcmL